MQALAKKDLLKGAKTRKLEFCGHCVLRKKIKVKFIVLNEFLIMCMQMVRVPLRMHMLEENTILSSLLIIISR